MISTLTEKISPFTKGKSRQSDADLRQVRWQLQREARALLPDERVAFCLRRIQATTVDVLYSPQYQSAHYGGLMVCGSVWVCPLCAAKISEHRRVELEQAIARCIANGGAVYLTTYTIAHKRYDNLSTLLQSFLQARKRMKQGRAAQALRQRFGILGTVSVREVTWSKLNGWHPHCHELVFCSAEIDTAEY
ncbi:MAG: protein rep, partial [Ktedonobacteraceae bacterium]